MRVISNLVKFYAQTLRTSDPFAALFLVQEPWLPVQELLQLRRPEILVRCCIRDCIQDLEPQLQMKPRHKFRHQHLHHRYRRRHLNRRPSKVIEVAFVKTQFLAALAKLAAESALDADTLASALAAELDNTASAAATFVVAAASSEFDIEDY